MKIDEHKDPVLFKTPVLWYRYLLLIGLSEELTREVERLKRLVKREIMGHFDGNGSKAHVTLLYADLPMEYERDLCMQIGASVARVSAFDIRFQGIHHFDHRTIYVDPVDKDLIDSLRKTVVAHTRGCRRLRRLRIHPSSRPHMTIAANLEPHDFERAWSILQPHEHLSSARVEEVTLLRYPIPFGKRYELVRTFPLS